MSGSKNRRRVHERGKSKVHVYFSHEPGPKEKLGGYVASLRPLFTSGTLLIAQASASAAVMSGILLSSQAPADLPKECAPEIMRFMNKKDSFRITDEVFWLSHPELKRRRILPGEKEFAREWHGYYKEVDLCSKKLGL